MKYASRAGEKLEYALQAFNISPSGLVCADFGSSTGGFVDCLLMNDAKRVYAVDTGYGGLAWKLRNDPRVIVMERTNAMHVELPEKMGFITIDASWTKLNKTVPNALRNLKTGGVIIALVKPHYEADQSMLVRGKLPDEQAREVAERAVGGLNVPLVSMVESPVLGGKGKNKEFLAYFRS